MPDVAFVLPEGSPLAELAATLEYELGLQDVPCSLHFGAFPPTGLKRVHVLVDPLRYVQLHGDDALPSEGVLRRTAFVCPERAISSDDAELLGRAGALFVLDPHQVVELARMDVRARALRPGYSRLLDRFDPSAERPLDVCFVGPASQRQARVLEIAAQVLAGYRCALPGHGADGSVSGSDEDRLAILARAKVAIELHADDGDSRLPWRRVLDAIHAGAVVVAEHSSGLAPLVAGEHLLVASADSLAYVVRTLLSDEQRLARMRAAAYERLSGWFPYALPVSILRAAIVELVGEPLPVEPAATGPSVVPPEGEAFSRTA